MGRTRSTGLLRLTAFVALGSLVLHQARYLAGYGGEAGEALARDGHSHAGMALPITLLIAVGLAAFTLLPAAFARPRRARSRAAGLRVGALKCAVGMIIAFSVQELTEGVLSASHPDGLQALLGHGGVIVIPLAVVLGCVVSFLLEALSSAEDRVALSVTFRRLANASPPDLGYAEPDIEPLAGLGLVFGLARRPPPLLTVSG